eukprot:9791001-Alexandrium_andersonii.AAC.1
MRSRETGPQLCTKRSWISWPALCPKSPWRPRPRHGSKKSLAAEALRDKAPRAGSRRAARRSPGTRG